MNTKLIIKENGKDEVYFSENYVIEQIKIAHRSGFSDGARQSINVYLNDFNKDELLEGFLKEIDKRFNELREKLIINPKN